MKQTKTWILIANKENARIVENDGPGKGVYQPPNKTHSALTSEGFRDKLGRAFQSNDSGRSGLEPHKGHSPSSNLFAVELITGLVEAKRAKEFDRLIICAPPNMLGDVRGLMPDDLQSLIIAELPKDLTHIATDKLSKHFEKFLAV